MSRRDELAASLKALEERVDAACRAAGRAREEIKLIAVTKTFPASDAALLSDLGIEHVGENRDQDAGPKAAEVARMRPEATLRWHMVGRLQRNKARSVVRWAHEVQSLDSPRLADALAKAVRAARDEGDVVAAGREPRAEVSADRTGAVHEDVHGTILPGRRAA